MRSRFLAAANLAASFAANLATIAAAAIAVFAPASHAGAADHLFVATTDFVASGNCAALDLAPPWTASKNLEPLGVAPVPRHFAGLHYVVCGAPESDLRILDPATFATIREIDFDSESNPQDVLPLGDGTAFVSFFDRDELRRIDLVTGETVALVDLGAFADTDGLPEMGRMARDGDHVFVQMQRIDRSPAPPPPRKGALAVVSVASNQLVDADAEAPGVQAVELTWYWPRLAMQIEGRLLYVSVPGAFQDVAGGIEAIDLDTLEPLGFVHHEKELGAFQLGAFVFVSPTRGYFIHHTDLTQSSHVVSFSRTTGTFLAEHFVCFGLVESYAFDPEAGFLYFPDSDPADPGVRVFDAATGSQLTSAPIAAGLSPVECVVARGEGTAAPAIAPGPRFAVFAAPNPARGAARFVVEAPRPGRYALRIVDTGGRVVRRWEDGAELGAGRAVVSWDGRDGAGRAAAAGVYFLRVDAPDGARTSGSVAVLR